MVYSIRVERLSSDKRHIEAVFSQKLHYDPKENHEENIVTAAMRVLLYPLGPAARGTVSFAAMVYENMDADLQAYRQFQQVAATRLFMLSC